MDYPCVSNIQTNYRGSFRIVRLIARFSKYDFWNLWKISVLHRKNPEQKFSDTDGYSVALYGHYLSSIIENIEDETLNTIIRQTWENFSDELLDPIDAFDAVLADYNSSFIESWVDFCSRNFHNGQFPDIDNDIINLHP